MLLIAGCTGGEDATPSPSPTATPPEDSPIPGDQLVPIPASSQRIGDPVAGWDYLIYGDYLAYGIPYETFTSTYESTENVLNRTGDAAALPHSYNAVISPNGVVVASPNCLACHAQTLFGTLVIGLGNVDIDATIDYTPLFYALDRSIKTTYGADSPEWDAWEPYRDPAVATSSYLLAPFKGVHVADKTFLALAAFRDSDDLEWTGMPGYPIPSQTVASDVPPWWNVRKKNALYYQAAGRGDAARLITAAMLSTVIDAREADAIDAHFPDVYAFLRSVEPPPFPGSIDMSRAARGAQTFEDRCARCHGTYGETDTYPNLLVGLETIGTDPELALSNYANDGFRTWYNNGWFQTEPGRGWLEPGEGYVAPPLDGIWATSPYLHNGSVPNLHALLQSSERPTFWKRTFDSYDYDLDRVGWRYDEVLEAADGVTYDTTLPGYSNRGHTFGDALDEETRLDVIEYLKTL